MKIGGPWRERKRNTLNREIKIERDGEIKKRQEKERGRGIRKRERKREKLRCTVKMYV